MTDTQILIMALTIGFSSVIIICLLLPYLQRKGVHVDAIIAEAKAVTAKISGMAEIITPFIAQGEVADISAKIISYATVGTNMAEQLYKIGELPKDERNEAAINYVTDDLQIAGVEITPEVERLTEGAIEAAVHTMNSASGILYAAEVETVVEVEEEADSA